MHTNSMGKKSFSNPFKPCEGRKGVMEAVWSWGPRASPRKAQMLLGALRPRAPSSPAGAPLQLLTPALPQSLSLRVAAWGRPGPPPPSPHPPQQVHPGGGARGPEGSCQPGFRRGGGAGAGAGAGTSGLGRFLWPRAPPPPAAVRRCEGARGGPRAGGGGLQAAPSPPTRRCRSAAGSGPRRALHPPGGPGSAGGAPREAAVACRAPEGLPRGASPPAAGKAPRPPPPSAPGAPRARRTPAVGSLGWSRAGRGGAGCRAVLGLPAQGGPLRAASPEKPQASPGAGPRAPAGAPRRSLAGPGGLRGGRGGFSASPGAAPGSRAGTRGSLGRSSVLEPAARRLC